jgi:hypothetical protein
MKELAMPSDTCQLERLPNGLDRPRCRARARAESEAISESLRAGLSAGTFNDHDAYWWTRIALEEVERAMTPCACESADPESAEPREQSSPSVP